MTRRGVHVLLVAGAAASILTGAYLGSIPGDVLYFCVCVPSCVLAWRGALRRRPDGHRGIWALLALMLTLSVSGDAVQTWQSYHGGPPEAGLSDVLWLGSYAPQIAALVLLARRRAGGQVRAAALDALTMATAAALASYLFFVGPLFATGERTVAATLVPAAYPLGDVLLLAATLVLLLSPGRHSGPARLLLASACVGLTSNIGWNVLPGHLSADWLVRLGAVAVFSNIIVTAAILHPDRGELTVARVWLNRLLPARTLFLGVDLLTAPAMAVIRTNLGPGERVAVFIATAVCAVLVLIRFMLAVREQERAQSQLSFQARHDPLTGLSNRTVLHERLDRGEPAVLLYLDLDGFKAVNDIYGHDAGDAVLTQVARRLSAAVRVDDLIVRLGGDEFVVVCPGEAIDDGIALAERILQDVAVPVAFRGEQLSVGASIGIAVHDPRPGDTATSALRSADEAMYQAKRFGRGRWILAGTVEAPALSVPAPRTAPVAIAAASG